MLDSVLSLKDSLGCKLLDNTHIYRYTTYIVHMIYNIYNYIVITYNYTCNDAFISYTRDHLPCSCVSYAFSCGLILPLLQAPMLQISCVPFSHYIYYIYIMYYIYIPTVKIGNIIYMYIILRYIYSILYNI